MNKSQFFWGGAAAPFSIDRSLRFNEDDDTYVDWTPSSAGDRTEWTWSMWFKRSSIEPSGTRGLFGSRTAANNTDYLEILFASDNRLLVQANSIAHLKTEQVFRDLSAWYHLVVAVDTSNSTPNDRIKMYINGDEVTDFNIRNNPGSGVNLGINQAGLHRIGRRPAGTDDFDGYIAEVNFIDGTAYGPSSFGETDEDTGEWVPKKYSGSYGSNGFYLSFSDNSSVSALGTDSSGNGNNWSPNSNFDVGSSPDTDSVEDTPTNNWCTLNPLTRFNGNAPSNGNLKFNAVGGGDGSILGTHVLEAGKKYYWEFEYTETGGGSQCPVGITSLFSANQFVKGGSTTGMFAFDFRGSAGTPQAKDEGSITNYGSKPSSGTICGIALDLSTGKMYAHKGNSYYNSGNPATGSGAVITGIPTNQDFLLHVSVDAGGGGNETTYEFNFGQQGFTYTAPTGFDAINNSNASEPDVVNPKEYFNAITYTGNNDTTRSFSTVGFKPDWTWIKNYTTTSSHVSTDSVRGATKVLFPHNTNGESTDTDTLTSFDSTGFSIGNDVKVNTNGNNYVAWNWKAGGSSNTFNVDGTGYSTASAAGLAGGTIDPFAASVSTTAGISILTYNGNNSSATSIAHGLSSAPKFIVVKSRETSPSGWSSHVAGHHDVGWGNGSTMTLNEASTPFDGYSTAPWGNLSPNTSVFYVGFVAGAGINSSSDDYIAYVFSEVKGFSKMGKYRGTNAANGTFVHCGFKPKWLLIKNIGQTWGWLMFDSARNTYNLADDYIILNTGAGAVSDSSRAVDFVSNGFKVRGDSSFHNSSSYDMIYVAFAESPFKYATAK